MKKLFLVVIITFISFGICLSIQYILNNRTESLILETSNLIDAKSKCKDSLQIVIDFTKIERNNFISQIGGNLKTWKNLEYTLTFPNAQASVYYRLDQEFVEKCKTLGYKDSESYFEFITEHSKETENERLTRISQLKREMTDAIEIKKILKSEIRTFTWVLKWSFLLSLSIVILLMILKSILKRN